MNQTMKLASRDGSNSRACQLALPVSRIWIQLAKTMFLCAGSIQRYSKTRGEKKIVFISKLFAGNRTREYSIKKIFGYETISHQSSVFIIIQHRVWRQDQTPNTFTALLFYDLQCEAVNRRKKPKLWLTVRRRERG